MEDSGEFTRPWTSEDEASATRSYSEVDNTRLIKPLNDTMEKRLPLLKLEGTEAYWAQKNPTLYGALGATLELLPYARYALPSNWEQFKGMDQQDQTNVLLHEALGATLWMFGGRVLKDVGYLARQTGKAAGGLFGMVAKGVGRVAKVPKIVPYEDAMRGIERILGTDVVKPYSYGEVVKKRLRGKGFGEDEAEAISAVLQGEDEGRLLDMVLERRFKGKEPTKAFEEAVKWESGRLYPRPGLKKAVVDEYAEDAIRAKFYNKQFERVLSQYVYKAKPTQRTTKYIFDAHAKRLFPDAPPADFGEVTMHQMGNILLDMIENKAVTWHIASPTLLPSLHPARIVFGLGEAYMKTKSLIYEPIKAALGRTNRNYFNHALLWAKMLEQRGALVKVGIKESGEFVTKKAKWLTPAVQQEAFNVLRQMDDITVAASKIATKAERDEALAGVRKLAKDASPGAKQLIEAWQSFSDHLYGEHIKLQIPRVFRKAGLTELGQSKISEMLRGVEGLEYEVDRLFSTLSEKNATEKILGVKEILKKARARLDYSGLEKHPYFKAEGKELEKLIAKAKEDLTWGNGRKGFTRYIENYTARVAKHEDALLMKWREGLFKNQSAFYTKARKLEKMRGEPVDFGTMLQARTMAHAKEHFFYDTVARVVDHTMGLPPAWIKYVDEYLGGILNVPTTSDYLLAQFFLRTVGKGERALSRVGKMMGREWGGEGLWSERRILNLAYTVNNMTYLGGLGFKPFSAIRNLFQPLLTVPADLGGLKDIGRLVSGYKWAFKPENRAYIRSLGAIEEYAPEINLRPSMLREGKTLFGKELPTMEATRDAAMWMFKGSDRFNRYVTGGAATLKWEAAVKRWGLPDTTQKVKYFSRKMGLDRRRDWIKADVEDLLLRGKFEEAKGVFVKDVIADTQFLYGAAEAPTIVRKYGGLGRTMFIFQSWWMNYGSLLQKWATTGSAPAKVERLFVGMVSQTMAYMLMEPLYGKRTASESTYLGAFPSEFNEFLLPPSWTPFYHIGAAVMNIQTPNVSARHAKAVLSSAMILVPAGLQLKSFYRGAKDEGFEGFSKAIIGLKPDKD